MKNRKEQFDELIDKPVSVDDIERLWEASRDQEMAEIIVEHPEVGELLNVFKAPEPYIRDHKRYRKIQLEGGEN